MSSKKGDPRNTRAYRAARIKVLNRDGHVCMYCGSSEDLTIDHVLSIKHHPDLAMDLSNMVIACKPCNSRKGSRSQGVFLAVNSTPPAYPSNFSPKTTSTVPAGPCAGQTEQN